MVTRDRLSPRGVACLFRVLEGHPSSAILVGAPSMSLTCREGINPTGLDADVFPERPQPRSLQPRDNPLLRFRSPTGFDPHYPPTPLSVSCLRTVPFPYSARGVGSPQYPRDPPSARSGFRVSHPLAGLLLPAPSGFVSPRWHSWGSALQGFLLPRSRATSSVCAMPSWRFFPTPTGRHG